MEWGNPNDTNATIEVPAVGTLWGGGGRKFLFGGILNKIRVPFFGGGEKRPIFRNEVLVSMVFRVNTIEPKCIIMYQSCPK